MEFFPNNTTTLSQQITVSNGGASATSNDSSERFLAGILDTFPLWAATGNEMHGNGASVLGNVGVGLGAGSIRNIVDSNMQENLQPNHKTSPESEFYLNSFMAGLDSLTSSANNNISRNNLGPIGCVRSNKMSPESNNSSTSIICSWCDINASMRCVDCNEFMCNDCIREHRKSSLSSNHSIISLPTPIGTSPTTGITTTITSNNVPSANLPSTNTSYICDLHNEVLRYVCDYCKKLVCQCCTLHEHKEHSYASIQSFVDEAQNKIDAALESSRMGTKCIKSSIDKALSFIRLIERNCSELTENIRKAFRQFILAIEDRERYMLDFVEKLRQRRLTTLHDQMAGLKSALSGLAETSEMLQKVYEQNEHLDHIDVAMKVTNGQRQLEQFAAIYKDLQPKHEIFVFVAPDYGLLQDLRNQGAVILLDEKNIPVVACGVTNNTDVAAVSNAALHNANGTIVPAAVTAASAMPAPAVAAAVALNTRRPLLRDNCYRLTSPSTYSRGGSACAVRTSGVDWELSAMRNSPGLHFGAPRSTQAIPGSAEHVKTRKSNALSLSFATEGHEDGQVSRPWGLCVDKLGNIFVSDRRNNRVQVFNAEGILKFKFGRKGVGNGEFDLPAGICVDIDNRIIVVDKDNHRVQIFNGTGAFLLKFGSYGKEYGQFQYPWDVAVNSRRQIVVTDSRNHRIQQFDSEGRFIRQIVFDNHGQNKGIASPRGVCYTPTGNIIVSDFDNHCLYLIDPDINEILSAKGHEGSGYPEFNRPSGLCCDDDGRIIVADSKNQRIVVFSPCLDYLWDIEVRPSLNPSMPPTLDEKDRTCDVALMPDGRIVFLIELSPDSKEGSNPYKRFVHVF